MKKESKYIITYRCPYCGEILNEEEAESAIDCGCPFCRRYIDWSDHEDLIEKIKDVD